MLSQQDNLAAMTSVSKEVLQTKLKKAIALADNTENDKFFDIQNFGEYYMKDAIDKKHGFYFLRVGTDQEQFDLSLKIKMFLKGDHVESTEKDQKVYVYNYPQDKFNGGDFKMTTYCNLRPEQGKKHCDFLVPTTHHDRTQLFVLKKIKVGSTVEESLAQNEIDPEKDEWGIYNYLFI